MGKSNLNPNLFSGKPKKLNRKSAQELIEGVLSGDRTDLSQAITRIESRQKSHFEEAREIVEACLPHSGKSVRIGITGVPGVGKSTFIEALGSHLVEQGKKLAVLAIDPTSSLSHGSILGDKTRMEKLSVHPNAFIRPSAAGETLGGVARATREAIVLCEAAGYDHIIVETVGVGQSETTVQGMTDVFLLLMLAGAGDELQGIKRGIMELTDLLLINKADGDNLDKAKQARQEYARAIHFFPPHPGGWTPRTGICSALSKTGIGDVLEVITSYKTHCMANGYWEEKRKTQNLNWFEEALQNALLDELLTDPNLKDKLSEVKASVETGHTSAFTGAHSLIHEFFNRQS